MGRNPSDMSMKVHSTGQFILGGLLAGTTFLIYAILVAAFSGASVTGIAFLISIWAAAMTVGVLATLWFGKKRS